MKGAETVKEIARRSGVNLEEGLHLADLTTLGIGGPIRSVLKPETIEQMGSLLEGLLDAGYRPRVMGGGANVVGGPGPFEDPIILTRGIKHGPTFEGNRARAGCGVVVKRLVRKCVEQGLSGLEFAEGIPGTVGGTVLMNAGSYGGQMADVVREVAFFDERGALQRRPLTREDFSYRHSPFQEGGVIVEVVFELTPGDVEAMRSRLKEISEKRLSSQPPGERSAGCIFRNPPGDSAGRLIDSLGLKGFSVGGAAISQWHGNFIVNRGGATPEDVLELIRIVKKRVADEAGVALQEEVIIWKR